MLKIYLLIRDMMMFRQGRKSSFVPLSFSDIGLLKLCNGKHNNILSVMIVRAAFNYQKSGNMDDLFLVDILPIDVCLSRNSFVKYIEELTDLGVLRRYQLNRSRYVVNPEYIPMFLLPGSIVDDLKDNMSLLEQKSPE